MILISIILETKIHFSISVKNVKELKLSEITVEDLNRNKRAITEDEEDNYDDDYDDNY